nr:cleaved prolactin-1, clPRL-1=fragment A [rats, Peptide Partial, 20 aa] [Rattus sp.]
LPVCSGGDCQTPLPELFDRV